MENFENYTIFILKVRRVGNKITYHKKFLVGSSFDKWVKITHPNFLSSLNVNHKVTYEDSKFSDISKQKAEVLNLLVIPANDLKLYYTIVD